jgi:hypothetical protein
MKLIKYCLATSLLVLQLAASSECERKEIPDEKTAQEKIEEIDTKLSDIYSEIVDLNYIPHSSQAIIIEQRLDELYVERKNLENQREALRSSSDLEKYDNAC